MEVAVIGISDEVIEEWNDALLPQGQVGEIVVSGNVTQLYFNRGSTALAKIKDEKPADIGRPGLLRR